MPDQAERDSPAIGMAAWNRDGVLVPGSTAVRLPVATFAAPAEDQALARSAPPKDHRYAPRVTKLFNWGGLHTVMVTLEPLPTDAPPTGFWVTTLPLSVALQWLVVVGAAVSPASVSAAVA